MHSLKLCNLKARSIKSKYADSLCCVQSCALDCFGSHGKRLETQSCSDSTWILDMIMQDLDSSGDGYALLCRDNIDVNMVVVGEKRSFEISEWIILGRGCCKLRIVVVYPLHYSPNHPGTTPWCAFFRRLRTIWSPLFFLRSRKLLVTGDFYIHVDVVGEPDRARFLELLETLGLPEHVITPTLWVWAYIALHYLGAMWNLGQDNACIWLSHITRLLLAF